MVGTGVSYAGMAAPARVYCIPLADSGGQFTEVWVSPDGSFSSPPLPPGAYRVLAFDRPQPELEYRNPEAMQSYEAKGPVVRLVSGQTEHVRLQLISTSE
jgi:putative hemolysin